MNKSIKKTISIIVAISIAIMVPFSLSTDKVYAKHHFKKPKVGVTYELRHSKFIYRNHTKKDGKKRRSELSDTAKKYAVKGIKKAKFKKGTTVTCLEVHKMWMRIPSGWIKVRKGDLKRARK